MPASEWEAPRTLVRDESATVEAARWRPRARAQDGAMTGGLRPPFETGYSRRRSSRERRQVRVARRLPSDAYAESRMNAPHLVEDAGADLVHVLDRGIAERRPPVRRALEKLEIDTRPIRSPRPVRAGSDMARRRPRSKSPVSRRFLPPLSASGPELETTLSSSASCRFFHRASTRTTFGGGLAPCWLRPNVHAP